MVPDASELNPLAIDDTAHMNGADEVLFPLPGLRAHTFQKAPSYSTPWSWRVPQLGLVID